MTTKAKTKYRINLNVAVDIEVNDPDVIERVTGPGGGDWRAQLYRLHTRADVLNHLAYNCVANGQESAAMLDGWADLPADAVSMSVYDIEQSSDIEVVEPDA